jgi:cytoskeletal protein CcmA (bactofilin family)
VLGRDKKEKQNYADHTLIAPSAEIKGDIAFSGGLHVLGTVEGNISVANGDGRLTIGESGCVKGEIRVNKVVVNGRVEGDVHATEHLELAEKAVVEGNVYYTLIEMIMGARVNGKLVRQDEQRHLPAPKDKDDAGEGKK